MDQSRGRTAADVLNTYPAADLARILRSYGEERFARRIADAVVRERAAAPFTTSARLVDLVRASVPAATRRTGGNPAKRTFQALRIEVNGELEALERALPAAVRALAVGGRIAVLSYHSLEDRLAKQVLAARTTSTAPLDLPVELPEHAPTFRLLTRGAETAPAPSRRPTRGPPRCACAPPSGCVRTRWRREPGSRRPRAGGVRRPPRAPGHPGAAHPADPARAAGVHALPAAVRRPLRRRPGGQPARRPGHQHRPVARGVHRARPGEPPGAAHRGRAGPQRAARRPGLAGRAVRARPRPRDGPQRQPRLHPDERRHRARLAGPRRRRHRPCRRVDPGRRARRRAAGAGHRRAGRPGRGRPDPGRGRPRRRGAGAAGGCRRDRGRRRHRAGRPGGPARRRRRGRVGGGTAATP